MPGRRWIGLMAVAGALALGAVAPAAPAGAHERPGERFLPFAEKTGSAADVFYRPLYERFERAERGGVTLDEVGALLGAGRYEQLEIVLGERSLPAAQAAQLATGPPGGAAVAHRSGARPEPSPPGRVPSGTYVSTGRTAGEPTLGVARDGTLYYVGIKATNDAPVSMLQRSRDEGRTWELLDPLGLGVPDSSKTLDPLMYLDPATDRLFNFDYTAPCSVIAFSDDRGDSFNHGLACNHADHQTLFAGPPPDGSPKPAGYPNVVYYCAIDGGASVAGLGITGCSRSLDGGVSYERTTPPYVTDYTRQEGGSLGIPGFCLGTTAHGRVGPDGTIYLPRGYCGTPTVAISRDEGDTWKIVEVGKELGMPVGLASDTLGIEEHEARVAIDPEGVVYYFWIARDHLPYLAVSRDGGDTFGEPMMVAPPGVEEAIMPAIAAGEAGRVAFSYMATSNSPGGPYCVRTMPNGCVTADGSPGKGAAEYAQTTWSGYIGMTVDATAADPLFYTAPVNDPADPLHRGYCGGIKCGATHEFHDVVIGPDGTPWASFVDGALPDPSVPSVDTGQGIGIVGRLVGGRPLVGTEPEQKPQIEMPRERCTRKRRLVIRLREPKRGRLRSAVVRVNGKRVKVRRRGRRLVAVVDLRRRAGTRVVVRVRARTTTGRTVRETRRYRVCG